MHVRMPSMMQSWVMLQVASDCRPGSITFPRSICRFRLQLALQLLQELIWTSGERYVIWDRFGPYFVSPVIAGLDEKTSTPYICGMDTIGAIETAEDFMVAGTAPDSLYGMCESMFRPDMVRVPSPSPCWLSGS